MKHCVTLPSLLLAFLLTVAPWWGGAAFANDLQVYCEVTGRSAMYYDGVLSGWGVEIVQELQKRVGSTVPIKPVPWARGFNTVLETPDTALFSTTLTEERDKKFFWIGPFLRVKWLLVGKKGSGIKVERLDDAKSVNKIGTYIEDARDHFLLRHGFLNLDRSTSNLLNYRKLMHGRVNLIATTSVGVVETAPEAGVDIGQLEIVYVMKEMDLYLAINKKTDPDTVNAWKKAFAEMQHDGTFAAIFEKWHPNQPVPMDQRRPWRD